MSKRCKIIGTGSYLPSRAITNDQLSAVVDTSDEWIRSRTGIGQRHLVGEGEGTSQMCLEAAKLALEDAGLEAKDLDLILVGTVTADTLTPSAACILQGALGAERAMAFDLNAACAGFLYALYTVEAYIRAGFVKNALIVGAETLSRIMDWEDRSTCVLFGDGAGAAVVSAAEEGGLLFASMGSDGSRNEAICCYSRRNGHPFVEVSGEGQGYLHMDGQGVYKFAVSTVPANILEVLDQAGLEPGDVDHYILHQANLRILQAVAKRLDLSLDKFPISLDRVGNVSAASIPILLDELHRQGRLQRGQKLILSGFGAGLVWGSALLEW